MSPGSGAAVATAPVLELRGVTAGYGRTTVLRDIDLAIPEGTIAGLLGPNGAGKTTLLRAASGLMGLKTGTVHVAGEDITGARAHTRARRGVCLIPEGRGIFPNLTVRENLELQVPPWVKDTAVDAAFEAFPAIRDRLGTRAGSLSGGQQQMVALARCFLCRPKVVLLDEVSMGLAPRIVDEIFESLQRLAAAGVTLLLVEQFVTRVLEMSHSVHLLNRGRLTYSGPPGGLDEEAVTRGYLGADIRTQTQEG